jgi:hypothetical protein
MRMNKDADQIIAPEEPSPDAVEVPVLEVFDGDGFNGSPLGEDRLARTQGTLLLDVSS